MRLDPIWVARRMRWLSPPERVAAERLRVRYPRPTDCKKPRRDLISFKIRAAMRICCSVSSSFSHQASSSVTDISVKEKMSRSPTVTARDSFFRRRPLHSGQGHSPMSSSSSLRLASDWVSR